MTTYLFPGQGSQFKGMGDDLFKAFPEIIAKANDILGYPIQELCLEDPDKRLSKTQYTQPALYIVNALTYYKKQQMSEAKPDFVAGHSLGEYNALLAARVFSFEDGLRLVKKRGELMSQASGGGMAAIIGLSAEKIKSIIGHNSINVSIANDNSYTQSVITGLKADVDLAQKLCEQAGASLVVPLNVSGAFHSQYMLSAQEQFVNFISNFKFSPPTLSVIANTTAKPYEATTIARELTQQITHPVRWTESIKYLLAQGETVFEEIGPGKVLTGLVQRINNGQ